MKPRAAITGIAGFLGSHIAEALLPEYEVIGYDNLSGGDKENVPDGAITYFEDCQDIRGDDFAGVDVVFHCAALAHEGLSVFSPRTITESIFGASVAVFSAAIAAGVRRIVYCSSMARYGNGYPPFVETDTPQPQDPYGIAKVAAEDVLRLLADVHGIEYIIAVPHNIIGPRQKYDDPFRNVASIMANRMLRGQQPIVYGDGEQTRCFSDIRDIIPLFMKMIEGDSGFVVNIGPDEEEVTINELVWRLQTIIPEAPNGIINYADRPQEVKHAVCSSDRARRIYGYRTNYLLDETLESLVLHIRERGTKPFRYHLPVEISTERTPVTWREELI
jgi:UDP-glucose 4-epimerase